MTDEIQKPVFKAPPKTRELPKMLSPQVPRTTEAMPSSIPVPPQPQPDLPRAQTTLLTPTQVEGKKQAQPTKEINTQKQNPYQKNFAEELNLPPKILETKVMGSILAGLFFFGLMMGCVMFGGSTTTKVQGLDGVIQNPDVQNKPRLGRCGGVSDPNRECVLYIMNAKTFDRLGSEFYQEAQNITGVPKYSIQLANLQYANALIRPGYIAQIYIPARR